MDVTPTDPEKDDTIKIGTLVNMSFKYDTILVNVANMSFKYNNEPVFVYTEHGQLGDTTNHLFWPKADLNSK